MVRCACSFGDDDKRKACFSKHSQLPPESFRLARLESLCWLILPWMSDAALEQLYILTNMNYYHDLCLCTVNLDIDILLVVILDHEYFFKQLRLLQSFALR